MRHSLIVLLAMGLGQSALATAPIPGCDFRYYNGDRNISSGEGFKVVAVKPEYQEIQTFGYQPARKTYQRKQAYDGGPWINIEREITPAKNTITQRRLVAPGYFKIEDHNGNFVGRFDQPTEVQNYVCNVLYRNYGKSTKK